VVEKRAAEVADADAVVVPQTNTAREGHLPVVDQDAVAAPVAAPVPVLDVIVAVDTRDDGVPAADAAGPGIGAAEQGLADDDVAAGFPAQDGPLPLEGQARPLGRSGENEETRHGHIPPILRPTAGRPWPPIRGSPRPPTTEMRSHGLERA